MKVKTLNIKDIDLIVNEFLKDIYETKNYNNNSNFVSVATVDKNIRISYDLLILISKNEYLKIKID